MEQFILPEGYHSPLTIRETEVAIKEVKDHFERALAKSLHLTRVSAPLFVKPESGLNDNLNGTERPVSFGIREQNDAPVEIVHSLAKWKRYALKRYDFHSGEGLYTDMSAIRRDEDTAQPAFSVCRPMGLGEDHLQRRTEHRNTSLHSSESLCCLKRN